MQNSVQVSEVPPECGLLVRLPTPRKSVLTQTTCPCCGSVTGTRLPIVDLNTNTVAWGDKATKLFPIQAEILHLLVRRFPGTVPYDTVISRVWGVDEPANGAEVSMKVHLCGMRRRLEKADIRFKIKTVWGEGYRLVLS